MSRAKRFPNDRRITVLRADLTEYREWQSVHLITWQGWTESEVVAMQSVEAV